MTTAPLLQGLSDSSVMAIVSMRGWSESELSLQQMNDFDSLKRLFKVDRKSWKKQGETGFCSSWED